MRCLPGVDDPPVTDRALPSECGHGTGGAENGAGRWAEQGAEDRSLKGRTRAGAKKVSLFSLLSSPPPSLRSLFSFVVAFFFFAFLAGSCGGTDGRRGSAGGVVDLRVGRGVPERVRGPQEESGPGATTPTVVGERARRTHREVATPLFSLGFLCKLLWVAPVSGEVELF